MILTEAVILADGYDLSGDTNNTSIAVTAAELDATTFTSGGAVERVAGLKDWNLTAEGFYSLAQDTDTFANIDNVRVFTIATDAQDGSVAYSGYAKTFGYETGATVGELAPYSIDVQGTGLAPGLVRGTVALPRANYTTSGFGVERNLGALSPSQKLYAFVHVASATGTAPVANVKVQSASSQAFTSPTDQITMNAVPVGSTVGTKAGAVANPWWRVSYTLTGTTPNFRMTVALAVV